MKREKIHNDRTGMKHLQLKEQNLILSYVIKVPHDTNASDNVFLHQGIVTTIYYVPTISQELYKMSNSSNYKCYTLIIQMKKLRMKSNVPTITKLT